ncbi:MAG: HNH endonuclease [Bryobacteraceae bacterium]
MNELVAEVRRRAGNRCEYCRFPQAAFRRSFHIEHIIAKQHGGATQLDNLAFACWHCNWKKGPNLAGIDPETGQVTALFHPRTDSWPHHFSARALKIGTLRVEIHGLTAIGRATVRALGMNDPMLQALRYELWIEGLLQDNA